LHGAKEMKKYSKKFFIVGYLVLLWCASLGVHYVTIASGYAVPKQNEYTYKKFSEGKVPYYVSAGLMIENISSGIPYFLMRHKDKAESGLSFNISANADDNDSQGFVLESLICVFDDGLEKQLVQAPKTMMYRKQDSKFSTLKLKSANFLFSEAVSRRESFDIKFKGHPVNSAESIQGTLRMEYSRDSGIMSGWVWQACQKTKAS